MRQLRPGHTARGREIIRKGETMHNPEFIPIALIIIAVVVCVIRIGGKWILPK
jgi:hypothetical protein